MSTGPLQPSVCFGAVRHERWRPVHRRFVYRLAFLRLPLSRLDELQVPLLGIDRPHVFGFYSADHGPRDGSPLLPWVRSVLDEHGLAHVADGEVMLQTMPRILGYVFNPVSFWFCHDRAGDLRAVLAEVNNTFSETHVYLLAHPDARPIVNADVLHARKCFHVSPFLACRGAYRFRFIQRDGLFSARVTYFDASECCLDTHLGGRANALTGRVMVLWLVRFPLMTLGVVVRIHWQALCLWWQRVPVRRKPSPPKQEVSR